MVHASVVLLAKEPLELGGQIVGVREARLGVVVVTLFQSTDVGGDVVVVGHGLMHALLPVPRLGLEVGPRGRETGDAFEAFFDGRADEVEPAQCFEALGFAGCVRGAGCRCLDSGLDGEAVGTFVVPKREDGGGIGSGVA